MEEIPEGAKLQNSAIAYSDLPAFHIHRSDTETDKQH